MPFHHFPVHFVYWTQIPAEVGGELSVSGNTVVSQELTVDEHGQLQWEDHPTDTEKAYKIRYLTADGTQTDEANAVHVAAFVGCTYHCG